jgi:hypothetical protein
MACTKSNNKSLYGLRISESEQAAAVTLLTCAVEVTVLSRNATTALTEVFCGFPALNNFLNSSSN